MAPPRCARLHCHTGGRRQFRFGSRLCENVDEQRTRRIVFSLCFFDGTRQRCSFLIQLIRGKRSTRKSDFGVFTQPGSFSTDSAGGRGRLMSASVKVCRRRPRARGATVMGPASENLHNSGRRPRSLRSTFHRLAEKALDQTFDRSRLCSHDQAARCLSLSAASPARGVCGMA
jgi:hypothetical protein